MHFVSKTTVASNLVLILMLGIDQNDIRERNHQVGHLCAIYSSATSVIAWLGKKSSTSDLTSLLKSERKEWHRYNTTETLITLVEFLNRRYWARVWVIQECLLPRHLDIWWGKLRVKATTFHHVVWDMASIYSSSKQRPLIWETPGRILLQYRDNYQRMCASHDSSTDVVRQKLRLHPLLESSYNSRCKLLHDKVYALPGVATDVAESQFPIIPDYGKSPQELLIEVLKSQCENRPYAAEKSGQLIKCLCDSLKVKRESLETDAFQQSTEIERQIHIVMSSVQETEPSITVAHRASYRQLPMETFDGACAFYAGKSQASNVFFSVLKSGVTWSESDQHQSQLGQDLRSNLDSRERREYYAALGEYIRASSLDKSLGFSSHGSTLALVQGLLHNGNPHASRKTSYGRIATTSALLDTARYFISQSTMRFGAGLGITRNIPGSYLSFEAYTPMTFPAPNTSVGLAKEWEPGMVVTQTSVPIVRKGLYWCLSHRRFGRWGGWNHYAL